ncbi:hypothetical protein QUF70_10045 [Desulfobacterales bacterium HSG17]|nr:hypothetical protein [Desulfobacterales bacterium HSG17]
MKAKKIIAGIIIIGMTFGITGVSFAGRKGDRCGNDRQTAKVNKRQNRQADRIYKGIRKGNITRHEFKSLMREQARIEKAEKRAKRDGRITKREREKLEIMQNRASDSIYEYKHNGRVARDARYQSRNHYRY